MSDWVRYNTPEYQEPPLHLRLKALKRRIAAWDEATRTEALQSLDTVRSKLVFGRFLCACIIDSTTEPTSKLMRKALHDYIAGRSSTNDSFHRYSHTPHHDRLMFLDVLEVELNKLQSRPHFADWCRTLKTSKSQESFQKF